MIKAFYIFLAIMSVHSMSVCMDDETVANLALEPVASWKEVGKFVGGAVAYQVHAHLGGLSEPYNVTHPSTVAYALIEDKMPAHWCSPNSCRGHDDCGSNCWALVAGMFADDPDDGHTGYRMAKLIAASGPQMTIVLTTSLLAKVRLSLRKVTHAEIARIKEALESGNAKFESIQNEDARALLDKHNTIKE
jgi:hypothetical protein